MILLDLGGIAPGLILAGTVIFVSWHVLYKPDCFMMGAPSAWTEPATCDSKRSHLKLIATVSIMAAVLIPMSLLAKKKR